MRTPATAFPVSESKTMPLIDVSTKSGVVGLSAHEPMVKKPKAMAHMVNVLPIKDSNTI